MALFEKPFRYVPHAEPADQVSDVDVVVVDAVTASDSAAPAAAAAEPEKAAAPEAAPAPALVVEAAPASIVEPARAPVVEPPPAPENASPAASVPGPTAAPAAAIAQGVVLAPAVAAPAAAAGFITRDEQGLRPAEAPGGLIAFSRVVPRDLKGTPRDLQRLISSIDESDPVLDQMRSLAASLHQARTGRELKIIAVTSSVSGEGKTLLAANLALTLTRSYMRQVLLIDADLRRPNLHRLFGTSSQDGISVALENVRDGRAVPVQEVAPRLALLPAGKPARDPISILASDAMQRLIAGASSTFDWIVIDTPPVGMLPDVGLLSSLSDAVLLVVEAGRVRYDLVQRTVESIGADRIFGVVLNKVPEREIVATYGMHYYAPYR